MPDKEIVKEYIGVLMVHSSYPSQNNKWILRFHDEKEKKSLQKEKR